MTPRPRRRPLSALQLRLKAPLGLLYLVFLAALSVPVMVSMTILCYASRAASLVTGRSADRRRDATERPAA